MENKEYESGTEISLELFWRVFRKNWLLLTGIAIVFAVLVGVAYSFVYTPVYSSRSKYYVSNVSTDTPLYSNGQTSGAVEMAKNCALYMDGSVVLSSVLEAAELEDEMEWTDLRSMITTNVAAESAVFTVVVTGPDAALNYRISKAVEQVLPTYVDYFNQQSDSPMVGMESAMLKVIDESERDNTPDNGGNRLKYPIYALILAFVAGYLILLVIRLTDRTIYGKTDFKEKMPSAPVFGVIPHWEIQTAESAGHHKKRKNFKRKNKFLRSNIEDRLISRDKTPFQISDAFQQLCTSVTFCSDGEKGCTIGVLSSVANSGKSFVMANLGISLSRLIDKKVLLVDADMRCPMQHQIFRLENKRGLSNLLAGQVDSKTYSPIAVGDGELYVIPSGTIPPNPMELLSSPKMEALMEEWKKEYDYILVDLPPIGGIPDALAVSKLISGFLYVLRSGLSDVQSAKETAQQIEEKDSKIYGYVITDVDEEYMGHYGYSKYYKYSKYSKYSNYYQHQPEQNKAKE